MLVVNYGKHQSYLVSWDDLWNWMFSVSYRRESVETVEIDSTELMWKASRLANWLLNVLPLCIQCDLLYQ